MPREILVVDCQYDFINGSLACENSEEAVKGIIALINANPDAKVYYSADWHSDNHFNHIKNGGIWPDHCIANTRGAEFHENFYTDIKNPAQRPNENNIYLKGTDDFHEEYSAFNAKNRQGHELNQDIGQEIIITGIASEFCVKESVLAFLKTGRKVEIIANLLGWVDEENHRKTLKELAALGIKIS